MAVTRAAWLCAKPHRHCGLMLASLIVIFSIKDISCLGTYVLCRPWDYIMLPLHAAPHKSYLCGGDRSTSSLEPVWTRPMRLESFRIIQLCGNTSKYYRAKQSRMTRPTRREVCALRIPTLPLFWLYICICIPCPASLDAVELSHSTFGSSSLVPPPYAQTARLRSSPPAPSFPRQPAPSSFPRQPARRWEALIRPHRVPWQRLAGEYDALWHEAVIGDINHIRSARQLNWTSV